MYISWQHYCVCTKPWHILLLICVLHIQMYLQSNLLLAIFSAIMFGFFTAVVSMTCMHDARWAFIRTHWDYITYITVCIYSHFAISHKPWVWQMVGSVHDFFNGASILTWTYQVAMVMWYVVNNKIEVF